MPYIYPEVDTLLKQPFIKEGDCVDLIKALVPGLIGKSTTSWKQGENVMEARRAGKVFPRGTAIATFEHGRFPQKCGPNYDGTRMSCKHAALLLRADPSGLWVMDQYKGDKNRLFISIVSSAFLRLASRNLQTAVIAMPATMPSPTS